MNDDDCGNMKEIKDELSDFIHEHFEYFINFFFNERSICSSFINIQFVVKKNKMCEGSTKEFVLIIGTIHFLFENLSSNLIEWIIVNVIVVVVIT